MNKLSNILDGQLANDFAALDAQSEVGKLAKLLPCEFSSDEVCAIAIEQKPRLNVAKLVRFNLSQPIGKRLAAADLQERLDGARQRGNLVALRAQIASEVSATLDAQRGLTEALMSL